MKTRVAVIGATGYMGAELIRLVAGHPAFDLVAVVGRPEAWKPLTALFPQLQTGRLRELRIELFDPEVLAARVDVAFLALPEGAAAQHARPLLERGVRVIDLSADFRLRDAAVFREFYGEHPAPDLADNAVYGLPELHRASLPGARLVAAPGGYTTAVVLGAAGPYALGLADPSGGVIADCKSGTSAAGRSPSVGSPFPQAGEGLAAFSPSAHRHRPEIEQELARIAGAPIRLTFVPHLAPTSSGILATIYLEPTAAGRALDTAGFSARLADHWSGESFVRVLPPGKLPSTAHVRGTNVCLVGAVVDRRADRLIVVAALDNMVKGAAGQAIQATNAVLGLPESAGLEAHPSDPLLIRCFQGHGASLVM